MFHKMNSKSNNGEANSGKGRKESKLLDVLMAARALSSIGGSDEEKSVQTPVIDHKPLNGEDCKIAKVTEEGNKEVVGDNDDEQGKDEEGDDKEETEKITPNPAAAKESAEDDEDEEDCDEPSTIKTFPEKLMEMLEHEDVTEAITWLPGGKSFSVINPKKFTANVLPKFFKSSKFESFVRKLYRWGFRQVDKGEIGHVTFYHKYFQRGNVSLAVAKLRSVTPSKLSNAANKAAKEKGICHANTSSVLPCGGPIDRPMLPAATQSLLAQLRKERGFGMKPTNPMMMSDIEKVLKMSNFPRMQMQMPMSNVGRPMPSSNSALGSSMATRILLKQQQLAAASNARQAAPMAHRPSFLASHKMAQMQAAAAKIQQSNSVQNQVRLQAAARWQTQLRQVLGRQNSGLGGGLGSEALVKSLSSRSLMSAPKKSHMFQNLPSTQPHYGQDIVKAAVDALNNAS